MSGLDIKSKIERALSDIFSDKYDAKITIKFVKENKHGDSNTSRIIDKTQVLDR